MKAAIMRNAQIVVDDMAMPTLVSFRNLSSTATARCSCALKWNPGATTWSLSCEIIRILLHEFCATSLWTNGYYGYNVSEKWYRYVLDRKDLILTVAPVSTPPSQGYPDFLGPSEALLKPNFSDENPDYRCQLSPDARSTANFIRNAKAEQLSANKI